jgi:nucleotide-binding universal stress UspA family protein
MAKHIMALLDFSHITDAVVQAAGELASLHHAKCWLVHIAAPDPDFVGYDVGPQYIRDSRASVLKEEHLQLQEYKSSLANLGVECEALLIMGPLYQTIDDEINKIGADTVILGSHGRSRLYEMVIGSVCEHLLRSSNVPLLIIPSKE